MVRAFFTGKNKSLKVGKVMFSCPVFYFVCYPNVVSLYSICAFFPFPTINSKFHFGFKIILNVTKSVSKKKKTYSAFEGKIFQITSPFD